MEAKHKVGETIRVNRALTLIHERCFTSSSPEWKAVKKVLKSE